jgi:hypothetical protein
VGEIKSVCKILVGTLGGKGSLERARHREIVDFIQLTQDVDHWRTLVAMVMKFRLEYEGISSFSGQYSASEDGLRLMDQVSE